jgi:hypothetical protein
MTTSLDKGTHCHTVRMVAHQTESTTNVIISNVDLQRWVGNAQVVEPDHKTKFSSRKGERGFIVLVCPIVDCKTPGVWSETAVEDGARILVGGIQVHQALRSKVTVEHEEHSSVIEQEGEALPVVLHHSGVSHLWVIINSRVVPVAVESSEVVFTRNSTAGARDTVQENPLKVRDHTRVNPGGL